MENEQSKTVTSPIDIRRQSREERGSLFDNVFSFSWVGLSPKTPPSSRLSSSSTNNASSSVSPRGLFGLLASSPIRSSSSVGSVQQSELLSLSASSPSLYSTSPSSIPSFSSRSPQKIPDLASSAHADDEPAWFQGDVMDKPIKPTDKPSKSTVEGICEKIIGLTLQLAKTPDYDGIQRLSLQVEALARDVTGDLEVQRSASMEGYLDTLDKASKQHYLTKMDKYNKRQERLTDYLKALEPELRNDFLTAAQSLYLNEPFFNELRTIAMQFVIDHAEDSSLSMVFSPGPSSSR